MDDTISRQQAIVTAVSAAIDWHRLANPQYSIAYSIGEAMRALPSAQRWMPVTEKLPETTDTYLVLVGINENGEGMHTEVRTADWNTVWQTWYVHTTRCLVGDIIKWMPISWKGEET